MNAVLGLMPECIQQIYVMGERDDILALSSSSSYRNGRTLAVIQSKNNNDSTPNYKKKQSCYCQIK
jgi:hypothetical protein